MPAKVLARITADSDHQAWREARRQFDGVFRIGSSDAPIIVLGEQFGRTPIDLWMEKMGHTDGPEENYDMRQGHLLEEVCAQEAAMEIERRLHRRHAILAHPEHEWMIADLDRVISRLDGPASSIRVWHGSQFRGPGIMECKAPRYGGMITVRENGPAPATVVQVLHQLAVTGWDWAVCAYYHRDFGVLTYPVLRKDNEDLIEEIIRRELAFWEYLQASELPPESEEPLEIRIPEAFRDATAWRDEDIWRAALQRLDYAKKQKETAEGIYLSAREDVEFLLGDMQEVHTPWGRISWKYGKPSTRLDKKHLQANLSSLRGRIREQLEPSETQKFKLLTYDRQDIDSILALVDQIPQALERSYKTSKPSRTFIPTIYGKELS